MAALAALIAAIAALGIVLVVAGFVPRDGTPRRPARPRRPRSSPLHILRRLSPRRRAIALAGLVVGAGLWIATGWLVFLIGVPIAAIALPAMFSADRATTRLATLDALEAWTRALAGLTVAGAGLEQTIAASLSSAGEAVRPHVTTLVARINARWRTSAALRAFADDVDDPTCDLIVMHLLLAERMRGPGLARALDDLADSISAEVRARRAIETDRAKPRQNTRIITVTTLLLFAVMPFTGAFMAPYATPLGQTLLACWLVAYAGVLVWLRRIATPPTAPRMLAAERRT